MQGLVAQLLGREFQLFGALLDSLLEPLLGLAQIRSYPRPVVEGWGRAALMLHDYGSAEKAYREALVREPGGGRALFGLADALRGLGRVADAEKTLAQARKAWDKADADLPQLKGSMRTAAGASGR